MNIEETNKIGNSFKGLYITLSPQERQQLLHILHRYDMLYHSSVCRILTNNYEPEEKFSGSYYEEDSTPQIGDDVYFRYTPELVDKGIIIDVQKMITPYNDEQYPFFQKIYACLIKNFADKNYYINTKNIYKINPNKEE